MSESDNLTRSLLGKLFRTEISLIRSYRAFLMLLPVHGFGHQTLHFFSTLLLERLYSLISF